MGAATAAKRAAPKAAALVTITMPGLAKGERYAGIILEKGKPAHHLILLPAEQTSITWTDAVAWAKKQGGELPSRREQSLLFANLKEHFKERFYWSAEQPAGYAAYAWGQGFGHGGQGYWRKGGTDPACAVRREIIR